MTIETNKGNFSNFRDIYKFMLEENIDTITLIKADFWGTNILLKGLNHEYTIKEIETLSK